MTESTKDAVKAAEAKPEELDAKDLDTVAGGWGRSMYTSYSSESAAFRREDDSTGGS
jgi:hypothetical protein